MSDVLTKEERELVERLRLILADYGMPRCVPGEVLIIDRLVAEVARLRARNDALERVAKAAEGARELLLRDCVMPERHGPTVDREVAEAICDSCAAQSRAQLRDALSALNPSAAPNSSGGAT